MFTRCPHCQTTFRITEEALEMAGGQVRCGRCTQVFDARAELMDELPAGAGRPAAPDESAALRSGAPSAASSDPERASGAAAGPAAVPAGAEPGDDGILFLPEDWRVDADHGSRHRGAWIAAGLVAALVLGGQLAHAYRSTLIRNEIVGDLVQRAYGALGIEVVPRWNPDGYRIRDWVATADQGAEGRSSLVIRAEIENRGADPLPQPHIYLALKDRWDAVVASRVFAPGDYLPASRAEQPLDVGATTIAELEVVDPGPDAYGFELDVCVRARNGVRCANDDVFR